MNRRQLISATGMASIAVLSGCVGVNIESAEDDKEQEKTDEAKKQGPWSVALAAESDYIDSVKMKFEDPGFIFSVDETMHISLNKEPPKTVSAVVLMIGGEQSESTSINTGETNAQLDVYFRDDFDANKEVELLAIQGGEEEDFGIWEGGQILERAPVTVEISE